MNQLFSTAKRKKLCNLYFISALCSPGHHSSHSFFSCGPSDKTSKERGMFDGLLDSRRPDNTSPGDTPTLSLICHPMQVDLCIFKWKCNIYTHFSKSPVTYWCFFISSRSCGWVAVTLGSPSERFLCVGMVRGWMWSLANTGCPSAQTVKVSAATSSCQLRFKSKGYRNEFNEWSMVGLD